MGAGEVDVSELLVEVLPHEVGMGSAKGSNDSVASIWAADVQEGFVDVQVVESVFTGVSSKLTGS